MKLTMLGTGRAVVTECYNTCFVLHEEGRYFLVDGGGGIGLLSRLKSAGIKWNRIRDMFVTHRHMDHIMGILWMIRMICQASKRGEYEGEARIYGHEEVIQILREVSCMLLSEKESRFIGKSVKLIPVTDREEREIIGHRVCFFDIHSTKARQFGFTMDLRENDRLTCCGDEPYNDSEKEIVQGSRWLLHESFCLGQDADRFHPYEKHHSTVKDACEQAEKLGIRNLVLYHTEDTDMTNRKQRYTEEGTLYFSGNLYVPDDIETICLDTGNFDTDNLEKVESNPDGIRTEENREDDAAMGEREQQRLEAFEEMLKNIQKEHDSIQRQMEELKDKGKTKSATYRQLMGRKMTYQSMISMYEVYGLL